MSTAERKEIRAKEDTLVAELRNIEERWYQYWMEHGFFRAEVRPDREPHVIMMPPPNVTGRLHMGHALQITIQDAITRMRRMQGYETLWLPGIDHAGIATQSVVERKLKEEQGLSRYDLGREKFLELVWDWVKEYGSIILDQIKRLGASCDWSRQRFTMDEGFYHAVMTAFVRLFEEGLIYRGEYLINWCPVDRTALSDEEVEDVEQEGCLYYIRYPLVEPVDGTEYVVVATTRPETMLGDTAVAVNPDDDRYKHLIGKKVLLPLVNREIPIIADDAVDPTFGTGAVKVTPAHDKVDFEIAKRHNLDFIIVFNPDATINEELGTPYSGLDRFEARKLIVEDLDQAGFLEKIESYRFAVPISSRSKAIIEPMLSRQWFVRMKPLAEPGIRVVREGDIQFFPPRWANEYFRWMENIRDWVISRQIWWGHRIPVWYWTDEEGNIDESQGYVVSVEQPEPGMVQDEDVLDTWFSSWLWPFATLGWPKETEDLKYFYPTTVLVSGYDILFFWIARMIMAGLHFTGEIPYRHVYITGMVKDKYGRWMSKSLGNGIDPLEMIEQYGADAVRYSLTVLCAQGQDIKLDPLKFEMGRNFINKIRNARNVFGRFMEPGKDYRRNRSFEELELVERWILHRLHTTIAEVDEDMARYRLNEALIKIYNLFWHDYCDWYLELIKPEPGQLMTEETIALAVELYETMMQLLHPFMPFITEELWQQLRPRQEGESIMVSPWPKQKPEEKDAEAAEAFAIVQEMISGIRNIKSEMKIPLSKEVEALVRVEDDHLRSIIEAHGRYFKRLARVQKLTVGKDLEKPPASASVVVGRHVVYVPLEGLINVEVERRRLQKEIEQKEQFLKRLEAKLGNEQFLTKAPAEVVERERQKARDATEELKKLRENLEALEV